MQESLNTRLDQWHELPEGSKGSPLTVSFVLEWANTTYNGIPRLFGFLDILRQQWQQMIDGQYPSDLDQEACHFLQCISPQPELLIVSGEHIGGTMMEEVSAGCAPAFIPAFHVNEGVEYYGLKNYGAELAGGDILCFLDSDVYPDEDWLMYLLGTLARPEIRAVAGQPYVAPIDLMSRAFALGWTYELQDPSGALIQCKKIYANNVAFDREIFNRVGFAPLKRRTRGAGSILGKELREMGYPVWENRKAQVDHPAPSGWKHLVIRAIAHGRDMCMNETEERSLRGFLHCQKTAAKRLWRGIANTCKNWRVVGLRSLEVIPAMFIITSYYILFSLGGMLTQVSPKLMGRHFRL